MLGCRHFWRRIGGGNGARESKLVPCLVPQHEEANCRDDELSGSLRAGVGGFSRSFCAGSKIAHAVFAAATTNQQQRERSSLAGFQEELARTLSAVALGEGKERGNLPQRCGAQRGLHANVGLVLYGTIVTIIFSGA